MKKQWEKPEIRIIKIKKEAKMKKLERIVLEYENALKQIIKIIREAKSLEAKEKIFKEILLPYQRERVRAILSMYKKQSHTPEEMKCYELLENAENVSSNGSSIIYLKDKELYNKTNEIIWEFIDDLLLDIESYEKKANTLLTVFLAASTFLIGMAGMMKVYGR